jgi:hypothetical protein
MPFDWRDFLIVAHRWRNDPSEGVKRTCLGRTYYYVYNLGLIKARTMNFQGKLPGLHNQLWRWCQSQTDTNIRQMGVWGARMHSLRIAADYYDTAIPSLSVEVQTQLSRAQRFEGFVANSNNQNPPPPLPLP